MADDEVDTSGPNRGAVVFPTPEERAARQANESESDRLGREEREMAGQPQEDVIESIKNLIQNAQINADAKDVKRRITQKSRDNYGRTVPVDPLSGNEKDPKMPRGKAVNAKLNAQRILLAVKTGHLDEPAGAPPGTPRQFDNFAVETIRKIGESLPADAVTENSGAFLYDLFRSLLNNDVSDFEGIIAYAGGDIRNLSHIDPHVYDLLTRGLRQVGVDRGHDIADIEKVLPTPATIEAKALSDAKDAQDPELQRLERDLDRALGRYTSKRDKEVIKAIYSPDQFMEFVKRVGEDPEKKYGDKLAKLRRDAPGSDAYWEEVSAIITREIGFTFGKLYRSAANQHPDKFLDEIANENALESISLARNYLNQSLIQLSEHFTDQDVRDKFKLDELQKSGALKFFSKRKRSFETEQVHRYTDQEGKTKTHTVLRDRRISVGRAQKVEIYEFLSGIKYQVERFIDHVLPYNHDVQALFLRQAGQDGTFWGQIGGFAGAKLSTFDLDSLNDIPDSPYVMSAFRIYSKFVKATYGRYDWNNQTGMFTENYDSPNTPIQLQVVEDLKRMFPELKDPENKWRIDQAMNIAMGVSRGVFLTEPTTVAWSDSPHKGEGTATFESYYTNSNAALLGLNPQHNPDRWKTPGMTAGPLLNMPVAGDNKSIREMTRRWDHTRLWNWMLKRENSYLQGLDSYGQVHPFDSVNNTHKHVGHGDPHDKRQRARFGRFVDKINSHFFSKVPLTSARREHKREKWEQRGLRRLVPFIDMLPNIGKVGGPIERGTWRNVAYEGWVIYDTEGKPDAIETFKSIENIGFEGVKWWIGEAKLAQVKRDHGGGNFTDEFGKYIFDKYIAPNSNTKKSYDQYTKDLKRKVVEKTGKKNSEGQYAEILVNRALAYMLKERVPTLMVSIERTRMTENGKRAWQVLREKCDWGKEERIGEIEDINRMDRALKNIMLVEQRVRQGTSEQMQQSLSDQVSAPENRDNPHFKPDLRKVVFEDGRDYKLNEERFKKELTFLFTGQTDGDMATATDQERNEFADALKLFQETQNYLTEDYMDDFAEKLRYNQKPEKFFPFAVAAEELDTSFLTFQSAGPDVMRRALSEIGLVESNVVKNIQENFIMKLRHISLHEQSFDPLIEAMEAVHNQLTSIQGEAYANEIADYMARIATAYFKKDSDSQGWFGKMLNIGKPHSLAGEFAGGSWKNIWEWDVAEQESFYRILDKSGILPDRPKNLNKPHDMVPKKFLGIKYGTKKMIFEDEAGTPAHTGLQIRKDMGARFFDLGFEIARKYLLLAIGGLLALYIVRALKEATDKK